VERVEYKAWELRRRTVMIPGTWNVFIGYERIVQRQDMYMHLGLLQYLRGSGVLLSCLLITQLPRHVPIPQIQSTILCSCLAQLWSPLESLRTTILSIRIKISSCCVRSSRLRFLPGLMWPGFGIWELSKLRLQRGRFVEVVSMDLNFLI
jgi:hypothetical protein